MKSYYTILSCILLTIFCTKTNAQEKRTYWKSENVTKVNNKSMWGITLAYMDMIAEMRIHISESNDSLYFSYPFEKKIKISDLRSLTDCRLKNTGELLDSVYEVTIEKDTLKIKFNYIGTAEKDNRFSLNLIPVKKDVYAKEVEGLKKDKQQILAKIKTIDLSSLNLPVTTPDYVKVKELSDLNPVQLAEDLADVRNGFKVTSNKLVLAKEKNKTEYSISGVENMNRLDLPAASINAVHFDNIELVSNAVNSKVEAIIVYQNNMDKSVISNLFDAISDKLTGDSLAQFGLPMIYDDKTSLGIHSFFAVSWTGKDKVVRLAIDDVPDDLFDKEIDKNIGLPETYNATDISKVFKHYLELIPQSRVRVYVLSKEFDKTLNLKENRSEGLTSGNLKDHVFRWKYDFEPWDDEE
ncbi:MULTISPECIES: hypothetical protein [unclassified Sphingobacterium]|uniref:hypothetical protein n=1 Tax=unclassified Sphingobacterium TaxID=2609468 RepID=UPI0025E2AEBC|nr:MULTISPECIES: hypothetical protein [unclassified Sphingobacterium]